MHRAARLVAISIAIAASGASSASADEPPLDKLRSLERRAGWPVRLGMTRREAQSACARVGAWSESGAILRCTVNDFFRHELELCGAVVCVSRLVVTGPSVPSRFRGIARDLRTHYGNPTEESSRGEHRVFYRFDAAHTIEVQQAASADALTITLRAPLGTP